LNVTADNKSNICRQVPLEPTILRPARDLNWYAVYTIPQHEKSALKQLELREIESFLPVYETVRVWNAYSGEVGHRFR
jgi:hypothetical protein